MKKAKNLKENESNFEFLSIGQGQTPTVSGIQNNYKYWIPGKFKYVITQIE